MINYLKGYPLIFKDKLIINIGGVGYGVFVCNNLLSQVKSNQEIELFIYTHVREDKLELFGVPSLQYLQIFEMILSVSGIGPKTALLIVNHHPSQIVTAIQNADIKFFTSIPRIGKKLAQKIIIELKGKLGSVKELDLTPLSKEAQDIQDALIGLGFEESAIREVLEKIDWQNLPTKDVLKQAIKLLTIKK